MSEFEPFPKIPRLNRDMVITEKIDGTNAQVLITTYTEDSHPASFEALSAAMDRIEDGRDMSAEFLNDPPMSAIVRNSRGMSAEFLNDPPMSAIVRNSRGIHTLVAGSRKRWITPGKQTDNQGFARYVQDNAHHLVALGEGRHFGEWWGQGIARRYDLGEKRFSLFNVGRWTDENTPENVYVVPTLYEGPFDTKRVQVEVEKLALLGSVAAPGYMNPEGVIVFHSALGSPFKVTCKDDEKRKGDGSPA